MYLLSSCWHDICGIMTADIVIEGVAQGDKRSQWSCVYYLYLAQWVSISNRLPTQPLTTFDQRSTPVRILSSSQTWKASLFITLFHVRGLSSDGSNWNCWKCIRSSYAIQFENISNSVSHCLETHFSWSTHITDLFFVSNEMIIKLVWLVLNIHLTLSTQVLSSTFYIFDIL